MFGQPSQLNRPPIFPVGLVHPPRIGFPVQQQGTVLQPGTPAQTVRGVQVQPMVPMMSSPIGEVRSMRPGQPIQAQQFGGQPIQAQQFVRQPIQAQQFGGQPMQAQQFGGQPMQAQQMQSPFRTFNTPGILQPIGLRPPTLRPVTGVRNFGTPVHAEQPSPAVLVDSQLEALKDLRHASGLNCIPVAAGLVAFKKAAQGSQLSKEQFLASYQKLLLDAGAALPQQDTQNKCFALFDRDGNGVVDMMELVCGISLLCQGTKEDKISAVFDVFDENRDGFISMDEMFKFLTSVFKVVLTPSMHQKMKEMGVDAETAEDLASVTSLECFKLADLNGDGKLSLDEFKSWFYGSPDDAANLFGPMGQLLR
eukprot:GEMP01018359.1.p1 GENE.GEMP01018359.1~~GEMP01018359.1.p1  ORF type:complete len:365 (+),score=92.45 GEMP01018359.1:1318-2412(+)